LLIRKDKEAMLDPYFQVLKLLEDYDEDYVELKSKCTGHCWMIQVKGGKIFLRHKHYQDQDYHKQRECPSIMMALKNIKQHDEFQMAGRPMNN
jgi:hypothetical protein